MKSFLAEDKVELVAGLFLICTFIAGAVASNFPSKSPLSAKLDQNRQVLSSVVSVPPTSTKPGEHQIRSLLKKVTVPNPL
jgi:hypothetical protein